jgi:hypothetical protein
MEVALKVETMVVAASMEELLPMVEQLFMKEERLLWLEPDMLLLLTIHRVSGAVKMISTRMISKLLLTNSPWTHTPNNLNTEVLLLEPEGHNNQMAG